jgi:predicted Zn finger-like uncharacterized protein
MRLVCPNCEAKYEVPDDAIPDTGRDVQCANCGHSWFHMRGRTASVAAPVEAPVGAAPGPVAEPAPAQEPQAVAEPAAEAEAVPTDAAEDMVSDPLNDVPAEPPVAQPDADPAMAEALAEVLPEAADAGDAAAAAAVVVEAVAEPEGETGPVDDPAQTAEGAIDIGVAVSEAAPEAAALSEPAAEGSDVADRQDAADPDPSAMPEPDDAESAGPDVHPPAAAAPGYAVDDSVLAILREEAEREANARRAESLESQTDLGIDAAMPAKAAAVAVAETKPAARRDLLPDVEEIKSTLRPSEMQADADGTPDFVAPPPEAPRGFRSGFLSLMTVAILGAALYLVAPRLGVMVPALSGPLEAYVSMIDSLRLGLDGMMRSATVAISG